MSANRSPADDDLCRLAAAECACGNLRRATRALSRLYEAALAPFDLTATQFSILVALRSRGTVPLSRLAEGLVLDRTSLYRAMRPLERRGFVRTRPGRTGRERTAAITEKGHGVLAQALPAWRAVQERFVDALGPATWPILRSAVESVVPAVQAIESGARAAHPAATARTARRS